MNTLFTRDPIVGGQLTPAVIKAINTAIRRYMPIAGKNVRVSYTVGGSIIEAKSGGGTSASAGQMIFPYKCKWSDNPTSDSSSSEIEGDTAGEYVFYLPTGSDANAAFNGVLNVNGKGVPFTPNMEYEDSSAPFDTKAWKSFSDFSVRGSDKNTSATELIVCAVFEQGSGAVTGSRNLVGKIMPLSRMEYSEGVGFVGNPIMFPVCAISETIEETVNDLPDGTQETKRKLKRHIEQFQFGEQTFNNVDLAPFHIAMTEDSGAVVTGGYFRYENVMFRLSQNYQITNEMAGNFVWLENGSSAGMESFQFGGEEAMNNRMSDPAALVIPLYKFTEVDDSGKFTVQQDLRAIPTAQCWMFEAMI